MLSCPVEGISCPNDEDAFKLVSVPQVEVHDVMLLTSYRRMLKRFVQFFDATTSPIVQVCTSTETFLLDVLAAVDAMKSFAFQDTTQDPRRQSLLRKHQYMELVTRMLEAPFDPWGGPFTMAYVSLFRPDSRPAYDPMQSNISMTLVELDDGSDEASHDSISTPPPGRFCLSETCMTTIFQIVRASNMLLFRMFSSCKPSDALSCGRALSVLMKMLGHGFKASFPLSYLIQEKFHLSGEFKSFSKIIRDFLDLIQRQGKSYRYVQFLVVLCTANGLAVPKVQEKICDLIFVPSEGYKDAILIQTRPTHTNTFEVCLPTRRGNEWKPLKDFYDEYYKSNLHTTLAPYFYGLLQLYVALCMDRNYKCIEILKDKFPRKCLLACVQDVKLARSIRAVLMNLLLVIHIDCDPQTVVASPNYTRIWKDTAMTMIQIPQVDTTKYALEDREFFRQVKDLLMDYIATRKGVIVVGVGELARNELTLAMLRTCQKLVEFGMFHSDLQELVGHLVDLLDCRTDTILLKHQDDDGTSQPVEYAVPLFENSVQRTKNPFSRQYSDAYPSLPYRPMKRLSYMGTKPRGAHQPCQTTVSRFKASEGNTIVMEIKDCICATLLRVDALRLDYQLSLVLSYVKERNRLGSMVASDLSPLAQALAQRTFHLTCEYSLQTLANHRRLDTILLQTLMYEHPLLVSKALELLYRQFNQHEQLIKALDHVFLLVNDNTVHVYAKLQADVNQLRHLAETTEVWMDLTSSGDFDAAARACVLLKSLNGLMQSTDDMTRLISNLDVLTYVMAMIYSGSHYFHELFPSKSTVSPTSPQKAAATSSLVHDVLQDQQRGAIRNVYDGCMEFLLAYCTTNVQAVAEFAMTLVEFVEALPSAQHVLLAIYSNDLCDAIPHDVLVQFVRWSVYYKHRSNDARYLTFLKDVAVSSTSTQQALLMQCMKNPILVDTQDVSDQTYAAEIFHLLTTVATTTQARDICAESIVTVNRWVDLFDQFQPTDFSNHPTETSDSFGVAAMKYLQLVLLPHEDCIYKMDDTLHVRLFDCALIPTLLAYFPKLNPALLVSAHLDMNEWMAAWFAYVFCSVSHTTVADASAGGSLHLCMRWLDQLWKSDLEALLVESCQRSSRPFLGIGLGGMRTSEPFLVDFAKPFGDILSDLQAYRAYCQAKTTDHHPSASLVSSLPPLAAIETPIKPLETGHDMIPALQTVPKQHKWLFGRWGRSNNNHKSAVLPSDPSPSAAARKLPSPRHYNMPNFGAYAEDDSSIVQDYLKYIRDHRLTKNAIRNELSAMMQSILCLEDALKEENVTNSGAPAVISTFDDVAAKLMLKQPKYVKMRLVLLDVFTRTILSLETESKRRRMQLKLDQLGLTDVIVDLISHSDDFTVFDKCVWLGIAMLDGMNARVQEKFHVLITQQHEHSAEFLGKFKLHLDMLFAHPHTDHSNHVEPKSGLLLSQIMYFSPKTRSDLSEPTSKYQSASRQFRFLQLLCEGHYLRNQMCMLGQGNNASSCVNVVEMATLVVVEFHSNVSWDAMALLRQVMDTITEFCQGPCPEAQMCVANYKFISAVNELLWRGSTTLTITAVELLRQLKASIVITLLSLLERRTDHEIHRRLVQELNLEAIKANLIVVHEYFHHKYHGNYDGNEACSRDAFLSMGFNLHILMQQLMEFQPSLISLLYPMDDVAYRHAYDFFDDRCARVEIVWPQTNVDHHHHASTTSNNHGDLISMYFPLHPICVCLTDRTKRRLQSEVSRDANKLNDFYDKTHDVIVEMQHQCTLRQYAWMAFLTRHLSRLKMAAFAWSLVLNALIVLYNHIDRQQVESPPPWIVQSAGYVHVALCLAMVTGHCINDVPLLFQQATTPSRTHVVSAYKQSNLSADNSSTLRFDSTVNETFQDVEDKVRAIGDPRMTRQHHRPPRWARVVWFVLWVVVWDAKTMYHLGLVGLSIGGAFFHQPLCFSFHVLDIVNRSSELRYVSKAIVYPGRSLLHILVLYLLSAYVFGFVGLVYFAKYFDKDDYNGCDTLWVCFLTSLDEGLKNNGGIGGFLAPSHRDTGDPLAYPRLAYDLLYYVGLIIILTNLAFGLIIDTFATLRTQHKENQDDLKDRCFICSIDCFTFNRMTKGFDHHTRHEHNIWHYIYLFVHLRKKHFTHYNGVELYLATRMAKRDGRRAKTWWVMEEDARVVVEVVLLLVPRARVDHVTWVPLEQRYRHWIPIMKPVRPRIN
ncbi:hypothetical protein DYB34_004874 [Aphanomyces astaci]|uniref:RyR/IP3R Homology associated domain-containing protein n=1 Tax=Aphanomyces astaci TaxID=112090 RepID=A0A3R7A4M9_APHAT|nr:hypothetical protein DYB34_004874 [Aphanomyces astaci]